MSAAATLDAGAAPAKKGKKKLIIMIAAILLVVVVGGVGAALYMKKKAAAEAEAADDAPASESHGGAHKPDLKHPPTFVPLDPFVINLADKDADRYAQIGISIEVDDAHYGDEMKAFMPAIRNGILMILSHKTSAELLDRPGKEQLAGEILREVSRTMGIEVEEPEAAPADKAHGDDDAPKPKKKSKKKAAEPNPIKHVHFSNFIVQ